MLDWHYIVLVLVCYLVVIAQRSNGFGLYWWQHLVRFGDRASLGTNGSFNVVLNIPPTMIGFLGLKYSPNLPFETSLNTISKHITFILLLMLLTSPVSHCHL